MSIGSTPPHASPDRSPALRLPRRLAVIAVATTLLLHAACATRPNAGASDSRRPPGHQTWGKVDLEDLEYPDSIGSLTVAKIHDYHDRELGVMIDFKDSSRPGAVIDVYVYPITKLETASLADVLAREVEAVAAGMEEVARQRGLSAGPVGSYAIGPSESKNRPGLAVVRRLRSRSQELISFALVAVRDHRFFKLRMTIPSDAGADDAGNYFQELVNVLWPAVHLRPPIESPKIGLTVYRNVFLAPQHEGCNLAGWMLYGAELMEQIEDGNYQNTFERELAARQRALDFWREERAEGKPCASDVFEAMSLADDEGFLSEYVYTAYGRNRWPEPDGLELSKFADWAHSNLKVHDPVVDPGVAVEWRTDEPDQNDSGE